MAVLQAVLVLLVLTSHSGAYLLDGRNFTHVLEALSQESLGVSDIQVHPNVYTFFISLQSNIQGLGHRARVIFHWGNPR